MDTQKDFTLEELTSRVPDAKIEDAGTLKTRKSVDVKASNINIGFECLDRDMWHVEKAYPHLAELGAKWARVQTGWGKCELEDGKFDFTWLDEIVDKLLSLGVQPWFNVTYGNMLHTDAPAPDAVGWVPIYSEKSMTAWLRFVGELTKHFMNRVSRYEIWNEPDITVFWKPERPDPKKYAELVITTSQEIRKHQTDAYIIGGAQASGMTQRGMEYLETCLRNGMGEYINAFSYHCYRPRPEGIREKDLQATRAMFKRHNVEIDLWQAESGCPSVGSKTEAMAGIPWTEEKQAKWLLRRITMDLDMETDLTTHFHMSDFYNYYKDGPVNKPAFFGLLRNDTYTRKPAYYAFQSVCSLYDADTSVDRELVAEFNLNETGNDDKDWLSLRYATFTRKGKPMFAYWYPAELNPEVNNAPVFEPGLIDIKLGNTRGDRIENPVLIDPITQKMYKIDQTVEEYPYSNTVNDKGKFCYENLPLLDYPLILTDMDAIQ